MWVWVWGKGLLACPGLLDPWISRQPGAAGTTGSDIWIAPSRVPCVDQGFDHPNCEARGIPPAQKGVEGFGAGPQEGKDLTPASQGARATAPVAG